MDLWVYFPPYENFFFPPKCCSHLEWPKKKKKPASPHCGNVVLIKSQKKKKNNPGFFSMILYTTFNVGTVTTLRWCLSHREKRSSESALL